MPDYGNVSINGNKYRVDMNSYRDKDVNDFSPRATTPGGQIFSDLNLYQQISQTDWRHGFGFFRLTDEAGYMRTDGFMDTRHEGLAMLYTQPTSPTAGVTFGNVKGFIRFGSYLVAYGTGGAWKTSTSAGTGWSAISVTGSAYSVNAAWVTGKYIFLALDGDRIYRSSSDLSTWTACGVNTNSVDYRWMAVHDGFVFAGKDQSSTQTVGNEVYFASEPDLADMHGSPADDTSVIYCGDDSGKTVGACSFAGYMVVFRTDGVYQINAGRDGAKRILDYWDLQNADNFNSYGVHNGTLVFPVLDKLFQWNGVRLSEITPKRLDDEYPYLTYGRYRNITVVGNFLYCIARTNDTTYVESLLCFDGVSWFKLGDLITKDVGGAVTVSALYYDPVWNQLWYAVQGAASVYTVSYVQMQTYSDFPHPSFPTTGTHDLVTSQIDGGYTRVKKSTPSLVIDADATATSYLLVFYSIDGGAWTAWGGKDGITNIINTDGVTTLNNPLGNTSGYSTIEYNKILLKFQFVTSVATVSPILMGYSLRMLLRPDTYYGWSMTIVIEHSLVEQRGHRDTRSTYAATIDLREARDSYAPVDFVDIHGDEYKVYVTSVTSNPVSYEEQSRGDKPSLHTYVTINLVEVARSRNLDGTRT